MTRAELIAAMDAAGVEDSGIILLDVPDWNLAYGQPKEVEKDEDGDCIITVDTY